MTFKIRWQTLLFLIFLTLVSAILLAELYYWLGELFSFSPWMAAAICNSLLAVLIIAFAARVPGGFAVATLPHSHLIELIKIRPHLAFLPAVLVLLVCTLLGLFSWLTIGDAEQNLRVFEIVWQQWAWIFWVPVVEELVFRRGFGNSFRRVGGLFWGSYFSVILFSLAHTNSSISAFSSDAWGIALGPLLLAICCEVIYLNSRRLAPAIAFHMACNATVVIFALLDERWLQWLGFLYQVG